MRDTKRLLGGFDCLELTSQLISDQNITSEPIKANQIGLSVAASLFVSNIASDVVLSSTVNSVTFTSYTPQVGDIISFTSGADSGVQIKIKSVSGMIAKVVSNFFVNPSPGDTFDILRYSYPLVTSSGSISVLALQGTSPWITKDQADGPVSPGTVALFSQLAGGQYNTVLPTLTNTQQSALQLDVNGKLLVNNPGAATEATLSALNDHYTINTTAVTSVGGSITNVTLLSANPTRKGFTLYNNSNSAAYVKLGSISSLISFTVKMAPASMFIDDYPGYLGQVDALWDSANGAMLITEFLT